MFFKFGEEVFTHFLCMRNHANIFIGKRNLEILGLIIRTLVVLIINLYM